MAVLSWPTIGVSGFVPLMFPDVVVHPSLGGSEEVLERNSRLGAMFSFPVLRHNVYRNFYGFLAHMQGGIRTVAIPLLDYRQQRGSGTGSPTVNGAVAEGATQIPSTGWTGSDPRLDRGAVIEISTSIGGVSVPRAYIMRQAANGASPTLAVWPPVKDALSGGESIVYLPNPDTGTFMRSTMRIQRPGDPAGEIFPSGGSPMLRGLTVSFIEAVRPDYTT